MTILLEQTVPVSRGFRVDASCCSLLFMRADTSQNDLHEKWMMLNPSLHHCHVKSPRSVMPRMTRVPFRITPGSRGGDCDQSGAHHMGARF